MLANTLAGQGLRVTGVQLFPCPTCVSETDRLIIAILEVCFQPLNIVRVGIDVLVVLKLLLELIDFIILFLPGSTSTLAPSDPYVELVVRLALHEGNFLLRFRHQSMLSVSGGLKSLLNLLVQGCL